MALPQTQRTENLWIPHVMLLLCIGTKYALGACSPGDAVKFDMIEPDAYNMTYADITDVSARPYGFSQSIWYYNRPDLKQPCFYVDGTSGRRVEIVIETEPPARLCFKTPTSQNMCFNGKQWYCLKAESDKFTIEFFCDDQCSEADVPFWFRMVKGVSADEDREDHWCEGRSRDEYPSNLQQLPADFVVTTTTFKPPGGAAGLQVSSWLLCTVLIVLASVLIMEVNL